MILFNFDFFDTELTKNTIQYLRNDYKEELLEEAHKWNFDGIGFKNKTALVNYIHEKKRIPENYFFVKKVSSRSWRMNEGTIESLYELFIEETPLHIDRERFYKLMLISSELMFSPNEKICFTIMLEDPYIQWTAQGIVDKVKKYNFQKVIKIVKIEESLERHLVHNGKTDALISREVLNGQNLYKIHFTNLIYYMRYFETSP